MTCRAGSRCLILAIFGAILAPASLAQFSRGTILGTVVDPSGSPVPNARVTAREVRTNFTRSTATLQAGDYEFIGLPIGQYAIEVEAQGFSRESRTEINLRVQDRLRMDFRLKLGAVTETVTVLGQAPLVEGDSSARGQIIQNRMILDLPLNSRDYLTLPLLTAGVNIGAPGAPQTYYFDRSVAANGQPADFNEYYIDGIVSSVALAALPGPRQSPDTIDEFKVMTSTYSAEFGGKAGLHLNLVSKSGTNEFHGSLFEFVRNDKFDARYFFAPGKPPYRWNNFGGSLGGRIQKDRLFFFAGYEGTRIREQSTRVTRVPTPAQLDGDLSGLAQLYDPFSSRPDPDRPGQRIRDPIPGNLIPSARLDPVTTTLARQFFPAPNAADPARNYVAALSRPTTIDVYNGKIDWRVTGSHNAFLKYSISHRPAYNPGTFPLVGGDNQLIRPQSAGANDTWVISPSTVAEFSLGYSRFIANFEQQNRGKDIAGEAGILGTSRDPFTFGSPILSTSDFGGFGDMAFRPNVETDNQYQALAKVSHRRGAHSLKVGVDYRKFGWSQFTDGYFNGLFSFTGIFTTQRSSTGSNSGLADLLLGAPASATVSGGLDRVRMFSWSLYSFITDDWQVTRNLTVNLGLRWEYNDPFVEEQDRFTFFNRATGKAVYPRTANTYGLAIPFPFEQADLGELSRPVRTNFAPRFGFAYRPMGSSKSAIRGGYGIYYNNPFSVDLLNVGGNFPWRLTRSVTSDPVLPELRVRDALVSTALPPLFGITYVHDQERRESITQQWSFGVQQELWLGLALDLSYVGAKRDHTLLYGVNFNQPPPGPGAIQPRRPYPQFSAVRAFMTNGSGSYHAMQLRVEKRYSRNLGILASYTWSKTLDDVEGFEGARLVEQWKEKSLGSMHRAHVFTGAFNYRLPFGKGQAFGAGLHPAVEAILGGWQASGIVTAQSGSPFNVGVAGDIANCGCGNRPDRIGNGNLPSGERNIDRWFDVPAFRVASPFVHGNAGKNILIGPGLATLDFALMKNFAVSERKNLQVRWESFNAFNHTNLGFPSATVNVPATAGRINSAGAARQMQFGIRFNF